LGQGELGELALDASMYGRRALLPLPQEERREKIIRITYIHKSECHLRVAF